MLYFTKKGRCMNKYIYNKYVVFHKRALCE